MKSRDAKGMRGAVQVVEFAFVCADPILPDIVGAVAPAGVDPRYLMEELYFGHTGGFGPVRAGVWRTADRLKVRWSGALVVTEGQRIPNSWWAEACDAKGELQTVDGQASLLSALAALLRGAGRTTGPSIEWTEENWGSSPESRVAGVPSETTNSALTFELQAAGHNPEPYRVEPGGDIRRWKGVAARLAGFERDLLGPIDMDLDRADFYQDPQRAVGLYPVFAFVGGGRWTHDERILSVRAIEGPGS